MNLSKYRGEGGSDPRENPRRTIESPGNRFVIHEHKAARFHYDLRLEIVDENEQISTLHSWVIPKNIPLEPEVSHLAIKVDDKQLSFLNKNNQMAGGEFGTGEIRIWDKGKWGLMKGSVASGRISFNLLGGIVKTRFVMQRQENAEDKNHWLIWRALGY